jgi:hypothetical protein
MTKGDFKKILGIIDRLVVANIWGIWMGFMLPYIAAPWIRHGLWDTYNQTIYYGKDDIPYMKWKFMENKIHVPKHQAD